MFRREQRKSQKHRRLSHAAIVCFSASAIAFFACAMGLLVNHALTGSLAISGTAAVGLIYLAMGLMNISQGEVSHIEVVVRPNPGGSGSDDDLSRTGAREEFCEVPATAPAGSSELVASAADSAESARD